MDHLQGGFQMPMAPPPLLNQPPQIFGGYTEHGIPIQQLPHDLAVAQMFGEHGLLEDTSEAKRRRIARVSHGQILAEIRIAGLYVRNQSLTELLPTPSRLAICVGRRRSSVMESCRLVHTA